jgi:hypothetical protein
MNKQFHIAPVSIGKLGHPKIMRLPIKERKAKYGNWRPIAKYHEGNETSSWRDRSSLPLNLLDARSVRLKCFFDLFAVYT